MPPMTSPSLTLVMPTISWEDPFGPCCRAAIAGLEPEDEAIVVFDGLPPPTPAWLSKGSVRLLHTEQRSGPAAARNLAARGAQGDILVFVDADVEVHADAMARIKAQFSRDPELAALFGSYDDTPAAPGVVSRFRNLLHHHTHSSHPGPATSFWAGLGAVRREWFLALGGFDATTYDRPCIEDIEFGLRLHEQGGRILLDPTIQGTHHKHWSLALMVRTDIQQRAIPWSRLILERRPKAATLNLQATARWSAAACLALLVLLPVAILVPNLRIGAALAIGLCLALLFTLNRSFHRLLIRRTGWLHGSLGVILHGLYLIYSSLTFALVAMAETSKRLTR
jgi:hypothetical protein